MALLQVTGTDFTLGGSKHLIFGATMYGSTGTTANMDTVVAAAVATNYNMLRIVNYMNPANPTDENVWIRVDYLLNICRLAGIRILMDFADYYTHLRDVLGISQQDMDWEEFLEFVLLRVNTINGRVYRDDDAIGILTIAGEPDITSADNLVTCYTNVSAQIKAIDQNHIVSCGGIEIHHPFERVCAISTIDTVCSHPYVTDEGKVANFLNIAGSHNKPWYMEEFGNPWYTGEEYRTKYLRNYYTWGLKYGCAGFLYWNFYPQSFSHNDYNIWTNSPITYRLVQAYSKMRVYSPRLTVEAAEFGGM